MTARIGYQLSSITPLLTTAENMKTSFAKIAEIGYRYVQLQGVPTEIPDEMISDALHEAGLECVATQEDYALGFGDMPEQAIQRAVAVGAGTLTCALIPNDVDSVERLEAFAKDLSRIANLVQAAGLRFAIHPIGPDYQDMDGQMVVDRLMALLPEHTRFTFCIAAAHSAEVEPNNVFDKYADRIDLVHFKDTARQADGSEHMMPLGQGSHKWGELLKRCDDEGVEYVFAEQEKWLKDPFDCAKESLDYLLGLKGY